MPSKGHGQRKARDTQKPSTILWVNRTSQNLKERTAAEDVAIRKHVHSWRRKAASNKSRSRQGSPSPDHVNEQPLATEIENQASTPGSATSSDTASPSSDVEQDVTRESSVEAEPVNGALSQALGAAFDPFAATAVPMTSEKVELLQHSQRFTMFAAWPRLMGAFDPTTTDWAANLRDALSDPLHSSALLACGAFAKSQAQKFDTSSLHSYLACKQSAIIELRQIIERQHLSKSTVLAIMHMVALEHQAGNFEQATSIQRGAKVIIEQLGDAVRWKAHEMAFITDIWLSVDDMELGCFAPELFDPGPWTRQSAVRQLSFTAARDQLTIPELRPDAHNFEIRLSDLFAAIRELTVVYDWLHITRSVEEKSKAALWLQMRATATKRRLMTYLILARAASRQPTGLLREHLVLAMCNSAVCYVCFAFVSADFVGIAPAGPQSVSSQIVTRVLYESELVTPEDRDDAALLWILFVKIAQEQYSRPDLPRHPEVTPFKRRFTELLNRLGCSSWLDARRVLQRYLYRPQLMDGILRELYNDCTAMSTE